MKKNKELQWIQRNVLAILIAIGPSDLEQIYKFYLKSTGRTSRSNLQKSINSLILRGYLYNENEIYHLTGML